MTTKYDSCKSKEILKYYSRKQTCSRQTRQRTKRKIKFLHINEIVFKAYEDIVQSILLKIGQIEYMKKA